MARYNVGWTYTLWTEVEADSEEEAIRISCETDHKVQCDPTATLELNEYDNPIVNKE